MDSVNDLAERRERDRQRALELAEQEHASIAAAMGWDEEDF